MRLEYFQMIDRVAAREGDAIIVESRIPERRLPAGCCWI